MFTVHGQGATRPSASARPDSTIPIETSIFAGNPLAASAAFPACAHEISAPARCANTIPSTSIKTGNRMTQDIQSPRVNDEHFTNRLMESL